MRLFLVVVSLLILGTFVTIAVATWVSRKPTFIRNVVAFFLAGGSSYSMGFVLNMWVLAATGSVPTGNVYWPIFTWLSICTICLVAAFLTTATPLTIALPFFINALLALVFAPAASYATFFITGPLFVIGIAIFFYRRRFVHGKVSTQPCFAIGSYHLTDPIGERADLVEFSPVEYTSMGRQFKNEKNYNAAPTSVLGRSWKVQLQTVNGRICKIALHVVLLNEQEASHVATQTLQYCTDQLGQPAQTETGFFIWDTTDGNVILQTADTAEGWLVSMFLTSRSIREFERL